MAITAIKRDWIGGPSIIRMITSDSLTSVGAVGYITAQAANIQLINAGNFDWVASDLVAVYSTADLAWGWYNINSTFTSLIANSSIAKSTATGNTPSLVTPAGVITTAALTTASGAATTITLTNPLITAASVIVCQVMGGGSNTVLGITLTVTPSAGSATIAVQNTGVAAAALNGTVKIGFHIV